MKRFYKRIISENIFDGVSYNAGLNYFGFDNSMKKFFYLGDSIIWAGGAYRLSSHIAQYKPGAEYAIDIFNEDVAKIDTAQ